MKLPRCLLSPAGPVRKQLVTLMGNKGAGGPFAPLVVVVRNAIGEKDFNKLRGKAISLHSQGKLRGCVCFDVALASFQMFFRELCAIELLLRAVLLSLAHTRYACQQSWNSFPCCRHSSKHCEVILHLLLTYCVLCLYCFD